MMKKLITHASEGVKVPDICGLAIELVNEEISNSTNMSLALIIIDSNASSQQHYHIKTEEIYYILDGEALIEIGGQATRVGKGHSIFIPVGKIHKITNIGKEPLRFISVDSPIFDQDDVFIS